MRKCEEKSTRNYTLWIKLPKYMPSSSIPKFYHKASRKIFSYIRGYIVLVLYYIVFPIIALAGSKMIFKKPKGVSAWQDWNKASSSNLITDSQGKNWLYQYFLWSFKPGNLWAIFLLPFIVLLWATEESDSMPSPESLMIYTLF